MKNLITLLFVLVSLSAFSQTTFDLVCHSNALLDNLNKCSTCDKKVVFTGIEVVRADGTISRRIPVPVSLECKSDDDGNPIFFEINGVKYYDYQLPSIASCEDLQSFAECLARGGGNDTNTTYEITGPIQGPNGSTYTLEGSDGSSDPILIPSVLDETIQYVPVVLNGDTVGYNSVHQGSNGENYTEGFTFPVDKVVTYSISDSSFVNGVKTYTLTDSEGNDQFIQFTDTDTQRTDAEICAAVAANCNAIIGEITYSTNADGDNVASFDFTDNAGNTVVREIVFPAGSGGSSSTVIKSNTEPTLDCNTFNGGVWIDSTSCNINKYYWTGPCDSGQWVLFDNDSISVINADLEMVYKFGFFISYVAHTSSDVNHSDVTNYSFEYFQYDESITDPYDVATWTVAQSSASNTLDNFQVPNPDTSYLFRVVVTDNCGRVYESDIDDPAFSRTIHVNNNNSHNNTFTNSLVKAMDKVKLDYTATNEDRWNFYIYNDVVEEDAAFLIGNANYNFQGGSSITHYNTASTANGTLRVNFVDNVTISGQGEEHIIHNGDNGAAAVNCVGMDNLELSDFKAIGRSNNNIAGVVISECTDVKLEKVHGISEGSGAQSHGIRLIKIPTKTVLNQCVGRTSGRAGAYYAIEVVESPRVIMTDTKGICDSDLPGSTFGYGIYVSNNSNVEMNGCDFYGGATTGVQYGVAIQIGLSTTDSSTVIATHCNFYGPNTSLENTATGFNASAKMRGSGSWIKAFNCNFFAKDTGGPAAIEIDPSTNFAELEFINCTVKSINNNFGFRMQGGVWTNAKIIATTVEAPTPFFNTITPISTTQIGSNETY